MRRHIIGALGLTGLLFAAFVLVTRGYQDGLNNPFPSFALRLGIVLSAIWLGMPDLNQLFEKYPPWTLLLALAIVVAIVANPKFFPFVMGLLLVTLAIQFVSRVVQPKK